MSLLDKIAFDEIIYREFWLEDKKISDFVSLFIKSESEQWYIVHFDDDELTWLVSETTEEIDKKVTLGDNVCKYPQIDLIEKFKVSSRIIDSCEEKLKSNIIELIINLDNGDSIILSYEKKSEKETIVYNK